MKHELVNLLRLPVRIKRKIQYRHRIGVGRNWMAQGFMESEAKSGELKQQLVNLLRLLAHTKRKIQYRHSICWSVA